MIIIEISLPLRVLQSVPGEVVGPPVDDAFLHGQMVGPPDNGPGSWL